VVSLCIPPSLTLFLVEISAFLGQGWGGLVCRFWFVGRYLVGDSTSNFQFIFQVTGLLQRGWVTGRVVCASFISCGWVAFRVFWQIVVKGLPKIFQRLIGELRSVLWLPVLVFWGWVACLG
jgi:hypothetical protein